MATLRFRYSPMNAGKSSNLLQVAHNYNERGMNVLLMKPSLDTKGDDTIVARGMKDSRKVDYLITPDMNVFDLVVNYLKQNNKEYTDNSFLIERIKKIENDPKKIDAMYNVINDYLVNQGYDNKFDNILSASEALFRYANSLEELTTVCVCGKKALHNARLVNGKYVNDGDQVAIDEQDDVTYISLCPEHYREFVYGIDISNEKKKINRLIKKR